MSAEVGFYMQVSIDAIVASKTNPRKIFDAAGMADLEASIREAGVQQPVLLRPMFDPDDGQLHVYEIVCGERRWRAATAAGLNTIPAIIREMDDEDAYQAQIVENLQREDLGPMEEADSYGLLSQAGAAIVDIASKVGKAAAYVAHRLQLLKLEDAVQDKLRAGELPIGHALEIAKLSAGQQLEALEHCFDRWSRMPSLPELKKHIEETYLLELSAAPFSIADAAMHPEAGACVDCKKRTGANNLLFADVQQGDSCLDAKCYKVKVQTVIHMRVEELKKKQDMVPLLSEIYQMEKGEAGGAIGRKDYELVVPAKSCEYVQFGVMVDGRKVGRKVKACLEKSCRVHMAKYSGGGRGGSSAGDAEKRKKQAAKDRRDTEVRLRMAKSIVNNIHSSRLMDHDVNIDDALDLAEYAFRRMDHAQDGRLAAVLGWDRDAMGWTGNSDRKDMLSGMGMRKAMSLAVLATVASDLTVNSTMGHNDAEHLYRVAERNDVDVEAIEALVDAEIQAKLDKKKPAAKKKVVAAPVPAKKVAKKAAVKAAPKKPLPRTISAESKKRIAAAMKKRWDATRKKAVAK